MSPQQRAELERLAAAAHNEGEIGGNAWYDWVYAAVHAVPALLAENERLRAALHLALSDHVERFGEPLDGDLCWCGIARAALAEPEP